MISGSEKIYSARRHEPFAFHRPTSKNVDLETMQLYAVVIVSCYLVLVKSTTDINYDLYFKVKKYMFSYVIYCIGDDNILKLFYSNLPGEIKIC